MREEDYITDAFRDVKDMCIVDMDVEVDIKHPCTRQIEIVLFGPGPNSYDVNFEPSSRSHSVELFRHHDGAAVGGQCGRNLNGLVFDDDAVISVAASEARAPFRGHYRPVEKLSTFHGLRSRGDWVLGVYDYDIDHMEGSVLDYRLHFTVAECDQTFHWRELTASDVSARKPDPRAQHANMVVGDSLFIFGGRGRGSGQTQHPKLLHDLWRFVQLYAFIG